MCTRGSLLIYYIPFAESVITNGATAETISLQLFEKAQRESSVQPFPKPFESL